MGFVLIESEITMPSLPRTLKTVWSSKIKILPFYTNQFPYQYLRVFIKFKTRLVFQDTLRTGNSKLVSDITLNKIG